MGFREIPAALLLSLSFGLCSDNTVWSEYGKSQKAICLVVACLKRLESRIAIPVDS